MRIRNVHRRHLPADGDRDEVSRLIDGLAGPDDRLWPAARWPPMRLDGPLRVGARGGHGPIRYRVEAYEPGRLVHFRFEWPTGFDGWHGFSLTGSDEDPVLEHLVDVRADWRSMLLWWAGLRSLHDALIEDALDNAEQATAGRVEAPAGWSVWVRLLRRMLTGRRRPRALPESGITGLRG